MTAVIFLVVLLFGLGIAVALFFVFKKLHEDAVPRQPKLLSDKPFLIYLFSSCGALAGLYYLGHITTGFWGWFWYTLLFGLTLAILAYIAYDALKRDAQAKKQRELLDKFAWQQRHLQTQIKGITSTLPSPARFNEQVSVALAALLERENLPTPGPAIRQEIANALTDIYKRTTTLPLTDQSISALEASLAHAQTFDPGAVREACVTAFSAFIRRLPAPGPHHFDLPLAELLDLGQITADLINPFRNQVLYERNICRSIWDNFHANAVKMGGGNAPVYPQELNSKLPKTELAHLYLRNTPFNQLLQTLVPFGFDDQTRFTHHWCMGDNGTGKTTYLRYFIKADLARVAKGECSLVVIDSKKLIREMRTLRIFAEELRDRVIIVDPKHPVALNPFYLPDNQCAEIFSYMLADIEGQASKLQRGAISYMVKAARTRPNPNLYVLRDFFALKKSRTDRMEAPEGIEGFDDNTRHWFLNVFPNLHQATREGVHQRLMNLIDTDFMCESLNADRCALDLFDELHEGGKVLLVDTDRGSLGKENTHVLGRVFIALIDQLSSRRTHYPPKSLKPIFVVIDEAHDYIQSDERFADIMEKARDQRIAMTVAHHHEGQIDARIQASLNNAGIKTQCDDIGSVRVKTRRRSYDIPIKQLDFDHEPPMTRQQYAEMRQRIDAKYGIRASAEPEPVAERYDEP